MRYVVRTLSAANIVGQLTLEAENEADVRGQLARLALRPLAIEPVSFSISRTRAAQKFSLLLFNQELLALLKAGLSVVEALEALVEKETRPVAQRVIGSLVTALHEGKRFSTALQEQPSIFPALYVGLVQAAENTSDLPQTLDRYILYRQRLDQVGSKVLSASLYPIILLCVGLGVTAFLVGFVVPRFAVVYQGTGRELPLLSQWLLNWGNFAAQHGKLLLGAFLLAAVSVFVLMRSLVTSGRLVVLLQRFPSIGERYRVYLLSRIYLTLGMLLQGGVPAVQAMTSVRAVVPAEWSHRLHLAQRDIEAGQAFSTAFGAHDLTTPVTVRMLRVGEQTGQLGAMLQQAAEFYEGDIARFIERFLRTFEPALMAAIGIVVGAIVVLLYMPIFDLAGSLQ